MLQIVDKLPEDRRSRFFKRSSVEDDILAFMNSGQRHCRITIKNVEGKRVAKRCYEWLRRRNLTHVSVHLIGGVCYLTNENVCAGGKHASHLMAVV